MAILVTWMIIVGIVAIIFEGFALSYSKIVKRENEKLRDRLAHAEAELANIKSKSDWSDY